MPIFQNSVVSKYLKTQNPEINTSNWRKYQAYFHNSVIQENIRNSKEEQYQEGFLRDLFVKILGYTLNPENNFNLTTELKNVKDSKKADGGIIINDKVVGVVELKGTNTTDLGKIEEQAFGYKNNQPECIYVITSNFEKLRFYIDNAIEHIEFNLFALNEQDFELLYLCLGFENIKNNIPKKLKEESLSQEELITKQLYKDYSLFKRELFQNLCELNPQFEPLELFKKSQKLLDRCLFLFFSEDRNLLPPNSVRLILKQWKQLQELDAYSPLYERFKKYFGYLNTGFKGKQYDVFAYNGGLFKPDEVLDNILIDDELLYRHSYKLSEYDFASEVDVNILGHIFENSLNELDEITAQLEGQLIDKSNTKRKKDGVFYTPKYITKYIVENTIGKLCKKKKSELDITDEAYQPAKQRSRKRLDNLNQYRNWLLQLTICDPACGSGAFLNQALDFLINEHRYIDELSAKYNKDALILSDVQNSILENNLFGVDLNEESVEIAKLSLWLRTAQPNRKLNDLNNNIKCGNSLIDDVSVAGNKAFNWQNEFPQIFEKGGFDVIIGNPPYVARNLNQSIKNYINSKFETAQYQLELYVAFMELGIRNIKKGGIVSYIVPNSWLKNLMMSDCRKFILENLNLKILLPNLENVFADASVDTMIFIGEKSIENIKGKVSINEFIHQEIRIKHTIEQSRFLKNEAFVFDVEINDEILPIIDKMKSNVVLVGELFDVTRGVNPYDRNTGQAPEIISNRAYHSSFKKDESFVPELKGLHASRYSYSWDKKHFISYGNWLAAPRQKKYFEGERIIFREILGKTLVSTLIEEDFIIDRSLYIAKLEEGMRYKYNSSYVLSILNSKLMAFFFRYSNNEFDNLFPKIRVAEFRKLPIKKVSLESQGMLIEKANNMILVNKDLQEITQKFQRNLQREFEQLDNLSKKLESWFELSYAEFLKELKKKKIELSLSQKAEWEDYFLTEKVKAQTIKSQINQTDYEIDQMVYALYGLTEKEIAIVEQC
ncbi:MAG: TaqI-like C-terminal specificity domain-containing protein [Gelidibacter sp.]